jgi:hypothetical protein
MGRAMPGWSAAILAADSATVLPPGQVGRVASTTGCCCGGGSWRGEEAELELMFVPVLALARKLVEDDVDVRRTRR